MTRRQPISPDLENWQRHCRTMRNLCHHHPCTFGMVLRHNYPAIPTVDPVFLPREVDPTYTTITNIGRDASRQFYEMPRLLLASLRRSSSTITASRSLVLIDHFTQRNPRFSSVYLFLQTNLVSSMARHHEPILGSSGVETNRSYDRPSLSQITRKPFAIVSL
jgi:hypothetical protein